MNHTTTAPIDYASHTAEGRQLRSQAVLAMISTAIQQVSALRSQLQMRRAARAQDCMTPACA